MSKGPVTQEWTHDLPLMQQSVLLTSMRGPDGIEKNHMSKLLLRWLRRCVLRLAFTGEVLTDPANPDGGSFTGPSLPPGLGPWPQRMNRLLYGYLSHVDEIPHHFQLHFMHAVEIVGYKHPDPDIRAWWHHAYLALVNDMHLNPETLDELDYRLADSESNWRECEVVTAKGPNT